MKFTLLQYGGLKRVDNYEPLVLMIMACIDSHDSPKAWSRHRLVYSYAGLASKFGAMCCAACCAVLRAVLRGLENHLCIFQFLQKMLRQMLRRFFELGFLL